MMTVRIPLAGRRGGHAMIDAADWPRVAERTWYHGTDGYVQSDKAPRCRLHVFLAAPPRGHEVDHKNGDRLDNRRENLRVVTHAENAQNVRTAKGDMRGVYYDSRGGGAWYGQVKHRGTKHSTGRFLTAAEAQAAVVALRLRVLPFSDPELRDDTVCGRR